MRHKTMVNFNKACDDPTMIQTIQQLGADIEYHTERTLTFILDGARMILGHNWDGERYVAVVTHGHPKGKRLEKVVKEAIEQ